MQYDLAGNVTTDSSKTQYTWDAENRIATAVGYNGSFSDSFSYDGDGRRVLKASPGTSSLGSVYWYGPDGSMTDETTVALNQSTGYARDLQRNFYFAGKLIARYGFPNNFYPSYFVLSDQLGTSRTTVDFRWTPPNSQYSPNTTYYYPFGTFFTTPNGDVTLDQRFTGKVRDSESGNDYFKYRYYASSIGRWMSPDESLDGAIMELPQTWNKYSYEYNRPLYGTDPDGRCPPCIGAIVGGVVEGGSISGSSCGTMAAT
jgi:RHS repeat-associated protein